MVRLYLSRAPIVDRMIHVNQRAACLPSLNHTIIFEISDFYKFSDIVEIFESEWWKMMRSQRDFVTKPFDFQNPTSSERHRGSTLCSKIDMPYAYPVSTQASDHFNIDNTNNRIHCNYSTPLIYTNTNECVKVAKTSINHFQRKKNYLFFTFNSLNLSYTSKNVVSLMYFNHNNKHLN